MYEKCVDFVYCGDYNKTITFQKGEEIMNFKKMLKGGLAAAMAMSMVACASKPAEEAAPEVTDAGNDEVTVAPFKVGASGPLSGDAAVYGLAVQRGAEIAFEEINAEGGFTYEFNMQDDQADPEQSPKAYNSLVDWGMQLSMVTVTSGAGQAVAGMYQEDQIWGMTPSGSSTAVVFDADGTPFGNVFQMCFTDPNQGSASAQYLFDHNDLGTKVGVIYRNDDNYSTGIYDTFTAKAAELGLEVVAVQTFTAGATDFSVQVKAMKDAGADVVFLPIYYQPASQILIEAKNEEYAPSWFGVDGMDGILTLEGFDTTLAEGVYLLTPFSADATDEKTANFVKKYQEKYGETPNQFAADAYDVAYLIDACVDKVEGVNSGMTAQELCEKMTEVVTSITFDGITGTSMTWAADGTVTKAPKAVVIQNGAYVGVAD